MSIVRINQEGLNFAPTAYLDLSPERFSGTFPNLISNEALLDLLNNIASGDFDYEFYVDSLEIRVTTTLNEVTYRMRQELWVEDKDDLSTSTYYSTSFDINEVEVASHYDIDIPYQRLLGAVGDNLQLLLEGNDELYGTPNSDVIYGYDGDDWIASGDGDDVLSGGNGTDTLDGGAGTNLLIVENLRSNLIIKRLSSETWEIDGDTLTGIERVNFLDLNVALDTTGIAGQAYRIYKAAFDRDPMDGDTGGLGYWIAQMDGGMDMVEVAARFIDSAEFRSLYGQNPTNGEFLNKVYLNVLDRLPDAGGYSWWLDQLDNNPEKTWEKVLADFSESPEN